MPIEIKNVSYIYMPNTPYEKLALKNINLSIEKGEFIGLIGHTGSGKSTLVQLFNGLLKPAKGTIFVDGKNLWEKKHVSPEVCRKVGLVFQYPEYQLFAETVFEDVAFGPRNLKLPESELPSLVKESLDIMGIDYAQFKDRSPFSLSGGQKRKAAIAGVIAMQPDILVLDEPTAGLDPAGRNDMIKLAQHLHRKKGRTIIWITHNMNEVAQLATRLVVMSEGQIITEGSPREIFAQEEKLKELGLEIPVAASLVRQLKKLGKPVQGTAITVPEALAEISRWLGG
ncbi:MAG: energy-coupling factor transporter ATPase [Desulfitobacteriaceae bacterium]|nr:energy-coupling factor transporter ATPase [Desulfitobacteriaceae bacterium]